MNKTLRNWLFFAALQVLLCLAVFGSALWGARILAPVDIAPALFPAYRFVDPLSDSIPDNHYVIDQLTYDLPLQTLVYESYRRGEIPWWDPYTYAGRPLLADAHINGTDPIRILAYLLMPFVDAYNWNLILHFVAAGAGMFALLSYFLFDFRWSLFFAAAWQLSGAFVMHFGHPWIGATFVWLPFLWLAWQKSLDQSTLSWGMAISGLICAAAFYSGNFQSHIYLVVFALVFLITHLERSLQRVLRLVILVCVGGLLGAMIASPVLINQFEFFLISTRETPGPSQWWNYPVRLVFTAAGIFPWATGSFRTLDVGRLAGATSAAWVVFCGSATVVLALIGLLSASRLTDTRLHLWKTGVGLVVAYLVIVATPLIDLFYFRSAGLGVLGLTPLAALGASALVSSSWSPLRRVCRAGIGMVAVVLVCLNIFAFVIYPRLEPSIEERVLAHDKRAGSLLGPAKELRKFQVRNLPREVSLRNPETVLSAGALALIFTALGASTAKSRQRLLISAIAASLLAQIGFASRYIPNQPVELWAKLRSGGPPQREAINAVAENGGRVLDEGMQVFPLAFGALYRTQTVHGYSALQPPSLYTQPKGLSVPDGYLADIRVAFDPGRGLTVDRIGPADGLSRIRPGNGASISAHNHGLNSLEFDFGAAPPSELVWTDTAYPGWFVSAGRLENIENSTFSRLILHDPETSKCVRLTYRPAYVNQSLVLSGLGIFICLGIFMTSHKKSTLETTDYNCDKRDPTSAAKPMLHLPRYRPFSLS